MKRFRDETNSGSRRGRKASNGVLNRFNCGIYLIDYMDVMAQVLHIELSAETHS